MASLARRGVVVTGLGAFTAAGRTVDELFAAFVAGRAGFSEIASFPTARGKTLAAQIHAPPLGAALRTTEFARRAIREALACAGLGDQRRLHAGLYFATAAGEAFELECRYEELMTTVACSDELRRAILAFPFHSITDVLARELGLVGPRRMNTNACASGNIAVGAALRAVEWGEVDVAVVCGSEQLRPTMYWGAERAGILGAELRAFDADRNGTVLGEGAAALVLEERAHAEARGARILAECVGYGVSCSDSPDEILPPMDGGGVARAILAALADAGERRDGVDHVNAHATGTVNIEIAECRGLHRALGERARTVPITATKSYSGHLSGASAVLEVVATVLAIDRGFIHPTLGLRREDEALGVSPVRAAGISGPVRCALSLSMGAGGVNSAVVLRAGGAARGARTSDEPDLDDSIWITSAVPVSPLGVGLDGFHEKLRRAAREPIPREVALEALAEIFDGIGRYDRYNRAAQLGLAAAVRAVRDAELPESLRRSERLGLFVGTWLGGNSSWSDRLCEAYTVKPRHVTPFIALSHGAHLCATLVSRELGIVGPTVTSTEGVTSGFHALADAVSALRRGHLDAAVVAATDIADRTVMRASGLLAKSAATHRSEGAAAFVIERAAAAKARGARPLACLGSVHEAYGSPGLGRYDFRSLSSALVEAARSAGGPDAVLFSCTTGEAARDRADASAIRRARRSGARLRTVVEIGKRIGDAGAATPMLVLATAVASLRVGALPVERAEQQFDAENTHLLVSATAPGGASSAVACYAVAARSASRGAS
jgi:3-oxoacyl-[acyl-carrier-protein] synthase II